MHMFHNLTHYYECKELFNTLLCNYASQMLPLIYFVPPVHHSTLSLAYVLEVDTNLFQVLWTQRAWVSWAFLKQGVAEFQFDWCAMIAGDMISFGYKNRHRARFEPWTSIELARLP